MQDVSKVLLMDARLAEAQDKPVFAVKRGGASVNQQSFVCPNPTNDTLQFVVQCPSLDVAMSRELVLGSYVTFGFDVQHVAAPAAPNLLIAAPAAHWSWAAAPLHRCMSAATCTINTESINCPVEQILQPLLRLEDDSAARLASTSPCALDPYATTASTGAINGAYTAVESARSADQLSNSCYVFEYVNPGTGQPLQPGVPYVFNGVTVNVNAAGQPVSTVQPAGGMAVQYPVAVRAYFQEALKISPLLSGSALSHDSSALFGVQNVSISLNLRPAASARVIRQTNPQVLIGNVRYVNAPGAATAWQQTAVSAVFLTPPPDYALPSKSVVPCHSFQPMQFPQALPAAAGGTQQVRSGAFALDTIPDYLLIYAQPTVPQPDDSDLFFPVQQLSITFLNQSGLLSGASAVDLWRMSSRNGLRIPWPQASGRAMSSAGPVPSSGAPLLLSVSKDLPLPADLGLAPGVQGQFSIACAATVLNQSGVARQITFVVCPVYAEFLTVANGQAARTRGVLSSSEVVATSKSAEKPVSMAALQRSLSGGGWRDWLASAAGKVAHLYHLTKPVISAAKPALLASQSDVLRQAGQVASDLGYGVRSGAGHHKRARHDPLEARYA